MPPGSALGSLRLLFGNISSVLPLASRGDLSQYGTSPPMTHLERRACPPDGIFCALVRKLVPLLLCGAAVALSPSVMAAGVTVITHGLYGDIDDWVISMASQITDYYSFPGNSSTCYELY